MSFGHIISNNFNNYSIFGNKNSDSNLKIALVVICLKETIFENFYSLNNLSNTFSNIIFLEDRVLKNFIFNPNKSKNNTRHIVFENNVSIGEKINIAAKEIDEEYFCVINSDTLVLNLKTNFYSLYKNFSIIVPKILNEDGDSITKVYMPCLNKNKFYVDICKKTDELSKTILPNNFIGLYNKENFFKIGGFDSVIFDDFFQSLDFGFRSYLMGFEIYFNNIFLVKANLNFKNIFQNINYYYSYFCLKNIYLKKQDNYFIVDTRKKFYAIFKLPFGFFKNLKMYKIIFEKVKTVSMNYIISPKELINNWRKNG